MDVNISVSDYVLILEETVIEMIPDLIRTIGQLEENFPMVGVV